MAIDYSGVGTTYRVEAEAAKGRMLFFAVVLVLAHLLDIRPSEINAVGFLISLKDPVILYGAISLVFGYYLSKFLSNVEKGESLHPLRAIPKRIRYNLRSGRRALLADKTVRRKGLTPKKLKRFTRQAMLLGNIALLPYRIVAVIFVLSAIIFGAVDLYELTMLIWSTSNVIGNIKNIIS